MSKKPIRVIHGAFDEFYDSLEGRTIEYIRECLKHFASIPDDADCYVNGKQVGDQFVVTAGDRVSFEQEFGQKGALSDFMSEAEIVSYYSQKAFDAWVRNGLSPTKLPAYRTADVLPFVSMNLDAQPKAVAVEVCPDRGVVTVDGEPFPIDRELALILQCLAAANGEIRSSGDLKKSHVELSEETHFERKIDTLKQHSSGIGRFVQSVKGRGYQLDLST